MDQKTESNQTVGEDAARWRFGEFVLDERLMELSIGDEKIELPRKPLELLMFLVRNPNEVVTKDELFDAVWPGRIVSETSLFNAVRSLRTALRDEAEQQLIKSVYGYGYRFMGQVVREDARIASLPAPEPALDFKDGDPLPFRNGWVLRQRLGAGGGGDVWLGMALATRETRVFKFARDHLALSALKREITLSRLMRESLGERPDLVRVLDWNLDEAPYFIGIDHCSEGSLSDWAEAHGGISAMPLDQRLELLAQAAEALAAAHSVGVLHKDLKPSNLLLQAEAKPGKLQLKLSDFGSARLIDRHRLDTLNIAQLGFTQTIADTSSGTPQYLAPELLDGSPPTIRSDVYALGVILYQLAVGDLRQPLSPGWERRIDDPLLIEDIGDAAAGDPQLRLADAAELASRLRSLPARREAREQEQLSREDAERTRLALDRARARRSLWMALAAVAITGMGLSFWQFLGARAAEKSATAAAKESAAVAAFLVDDVLGAANPMKQSGTELTVKTMLDQAAGRIASRLQDQPGVRARIEMGLASAYQAAGVWEAQIHQLELALKDAEAAEGPYGETTIDVVTRLAVALDGPAEYQRVAALYQRVLASEPRLGPKHPLILNALAGQALLDYRQGRFAESIKGYESYLSRTPARTGTGGDIETIIAVEIRLALSLAALARYPEAEALARKALADESAYSGPDSARSHWVRVDLGDVLISAGKYGDAEAVLETAETGLLATLGSEHPFTVSALHLRGKTRLLNGDAVAALPLLERAYTVRRRSLGEAHLRTQFTAVQLGRALTQLHREREAVPLLEKALEVIEAGLSPQHPTAIEARANLAEALFRSGDRARAANLMDQGRPWAAQLSPNFHRFKDVEAELQ